MRSFFVLSEREKETIKTRGQAKTTRAKKNKGQKAMQREKEKGK